MALVDYWVEGDFPFAIVKHDELGTLCGYMGVPPVHPWYGKHCDDLDVEVHGGLTYGHHQNWGHPLEIARAEQQIAEALKGKETFPGLWETLARGHSRHLEFEQAHAGEDSEYPVKTGLDIWWFGFDCAHAGDLIPGLSHHSPLLQASEVYRDEEYVRGQLKYLGAQAAIALREQEVRQYGVDSRDAGLPGSRRPVGAYEAHGAGHG
jgi:hypothetical protein